MATYILLSLLAAVGVATVAFTGWRAGRRAAVTPQISLAFALVLAGIFFGAERWLGYGLIGGGVVLAVLAMRRHSTPDAE
jgi:hypothetical protein